MARFLKKWNNGMVVSFSIMGDNAIELDVATLSERMQENLMIHGALQKIGDSASGRSKTQDAKGAEADINGTIAALVADNWNRAGGGTGTADLVQALADVAQQAVEAAQAAYDALDEDNLKKLKAHPGIKARVKEIQAERAKAAAEAAPVVDLADMFK